MMVDCLRIETEKAETVRVMLIMTYCCSLCTDISTFGDIFSSSVLRVTEFIVSKTKEKKYKGN